MQGFEEFILRDVLCIGAIALVLALLLHGYLRRNNPELGWGSIGNVWTQPFGVADLPVVGLMTALIYWTVVSAGAGASANAVPAAEMGLEEAWFSIVLSLFLLSALLFFLGFLREMNLSEVFGLLRMGPLRILGLSVTLMLIVFPIVHLVQQGVNAFVLEGVVERLKAQEVVQIFANTEDARVKVALILSICLVAPVVEEFLFRGYIYAVVKRFSDRSFSALFTSSIFAVVHLNVLSLAPLWALALCFTIAYEVTGCLWVPIAMHALFNTVSVAVILAFPDLI